MPRVVLKSTSQYGPQDPQSQEARSSWEPSSDSKSYGKPVATHRGSQNIWSASFRSREAKCNTREQSKDQSRSSRTTNLKSQSFIQDLSQTQKIKKFSKESQDLIANLNNTEIFELCENSSKQKCPDCNLHWERGILYCSSGRNMKWSRKTAVVVWSTVHQVDKRCTTKQDRWLKRPDKQNTDAIQRYFHVGMPKKITESHCQPQGGKNTT